MESRWFEWAGKNIPIKKMQKSDLYDERNVLHKGVQVVNGRVVEEALDLAAMEIDRQHPVYTCSLEQHRHVRG